MILVDANLVLYAEDSLSEHHETARTWWDAQLSGLDSVGLCWPVLSAFIRIGTNTRLHQRPLTLKEAAERVQSWFNQPCVRIVQPTDQHWTIFQQMLQSGKATGNLVSDAHLAALAVEHNCTLYSTDTDFARFKGLKWKNPISK
ncbi:MAG TPA: type II toxin-antitoxin system VapC family toxin [Verrucomicrobiae bacterium]|nr:type II toxin-antitoxin system VapC family toxin [Verrucomicrobiae bacterium]